MQVMNFILKNENKDKDKGICYYKPEITNVKDWNADNADESNADLG